MKTVWKVNKMKIKHNDDPAVKLLESRGIDDPEAFLRITRKKLHNPYKMRGLKKAVLKIEDAIAKKKKIRIYGDYDADGVSSTSFWMMMLDELEADVSFFVPNRFTDGYGVHKHVLDQFADDGVDLIITCDTGITAIEQVAYAKSLGMDIIITDHHEPQLASIFTPATQSLGKTVQDASFNTYLIPDCIVVNPKRPDCKYPFKSLAGVGVSFKILCALCDRLHMFGKTAAYAYMDLVALGTIADLMEMVDENRVIGALGLDMMSKTKNRGLYQLLKANELKGKEITSKDVGWTLAPCINAAGRIISADQAVEMIISDNKLDAMRYAKELVRINTERKELTKAYVGDIIDAINASQTASPTAIIVHYHPAIPEGIVGLVAARVSNHFYKPTIILTDAEESGMYKGSGRSIDAFDLFQSLMPYNDLLANFGGHKAACGLSLHADNFDALKDRLEIYAAAMLSAKDLQKKIYIDAIIPNGDILDISFVEDLEVLEPFGNGNKQPLFMMSNMRIINVKPVGDDKNHFWALLSDGKTTFGTIGFFLWEKYEQEGKPSRLDIVFHPVKNEYPKGSGRVNVQLVIEDLRKHEKSKK